MFQKKKEQERNDSKKDHGIIQERTPERLGELLEYNRIVMPVKRLQEVGD